MSFSFRPGVRENVGLLIGLVGPSGGGKTYTAMELASGIAGDKPFAVIDTEARRALHYADRFRFDHGDLKPPFRPDAYSDAIKAADDAGYTVIVVDNMSHVHYGEGGILEWHDEELDRMAGNDWDKRDRCTQAAWIKPKMSHKRMVQRLLQVRAHLIICLRAEEKTKMIKNPQSGKMVPTNIGWQPICEKNLPYELTVSVLLEPERPGVPIPLKLQEQHRELFPAGKQLTHSSGRLIAQWASGGKPADLSDVLADIEGALTVADLRAVGAGMAARVMPPQDTQAARGAYKKRLEELKPPPEPEPEPVRPSLCAHPDCDAEAVDNTFKCEAHQ
jgi:hypothetical protein